MIKFILAIATMSLLTMSCSHDDGGGTPSESESEIRAKALAEKDRAALSTVLVATNLTPTFSTALTNFFGGATGTDFRNYFEARIHFLLTGDDYVDLMNNSLHGALGKPSPSIAKTDQKAKDSKLSLGGLNIGAILWLEALINGENGLAFTFRDQGVSLNSTRVGLMVIGDGYSDPPQIVRQAILIHEARHSDCPTGLTAKDIAALKLSPKTETLAQLNKGSCGHLHSVCPSWHQFHGQEVCDSMPWGAYTAGAIFVKALMRDDMSEDDRQVASIIYYDQIGRVLVNVTDMMAGKLGTPKMESQAVVGSDQ